MINTYLVDLKSKAYNKYFEYFLWYHCIKHRYLNDTEVFVINTNKYYAYEIKKLPYISSIAINKPIEIDYGPEDVIIPIGSEDVTKMNILDRPDWGVYKIGAPSMWKKGFTGQGVNVAVIDSGIAKHKSLDIKGNVSFISCESANDTFGHGTSMAGVIAALPNEGPITGVAYGCNLFNVKAMTNIQSNKVGLLGIIRALEWCIDNNMNVINLSVGFENLPIDAIDILRQAINEVINSGITVVAASGNSNKDYVGLPGRFENVLAIGAVNKENQRWVNNNKPNTGSSYGFDLDFVAPGVKIATTDLNDSYAYATGTSIAAPHVTGLVALLLSQNPKLTPFEIYNILREYVLPIPLFPPGFDIEYGYGLVQAPL